MTPTTKAPTALRIATGVTAAFFASLPAILALVVTCGEPPHSNGLTNALCTEHSGPVVPWYALIAVAPLAVLAAGVIARRSGQALVFEVAWLLCVCLGLALFLGPALAA